MTGLTQRLCPECIDVANDEDPAPWCDCRDDERCKGPCRKRAHEPRHCPDTLIEASDAHTWPAP